MLRSPLGFLQHAAAVHGPIFQVQLWRRNFVFVSSAELAEPILGREFEDTTISDSLRKALHPMLGESVATTVDPVYWDALHRQMLPMFTPRMMRNYFESTIDAIGDEVDDLERYAALGTTVDLYGAIRYGTFLALTRTLFNRGMDADEVPAVLERFSRSNKYVSARYLTDSSPLVLALPSVRRGKRDLEAINARAMQLIAERRGDLRAEAEDMLDVLIASVDDRGEHLSDERIRENVTALWFGGQETTPTDYTRSVIDEAMRIYPPFVFMQREAIRDIELGGYPIGKGQQLAFFAYGIHRDPKNWPDPERVDPERHTPELRKTRERCAFLPFGHGKRRCLGSRIGQMESTLMVAMVSQRLIFQHAGASLPAPKAELSIKPAGGMPVFVKRR